jgi:multiple antibiotic resistance protein
MKILAMAFSLFLLMDSIGNIPLFISILKDIPRKRQMQIILRELLIALGVMVLFNYLGDFLLSALQVTQYSVLISGGIILFLIALKMIFPVQHDGEAAQKGEKGGEKEPFIVPLAIPLVAGPAVLAAIILYSKQDSGTIIAIVAAWIVTTLILMSSTFLNKILGRRGIIACERLMGLILTMVAIQMFLEGLAQFLLALHPS